MIIAFTISQVYSLVVFVTCSQTSEAVTRSGYSQQFKLRTPLIGEGSIGKQIHTQVKSKGAVSFDRCLS
jgi:hypothetical protein